MATGFCKLTPATQRWMEETDAVTSWDTFGRDYALFAYDDQADFGDPLELPICFADDDWDDAIIPAVDQAIEEAIKGLDATQREREQVRDMTWSGLENDIIAAGHADTFARQFLGRLRDAAIS